MTITSIALLDLLSYHKDNAITIQIFEYLFGEYYGPVFGESFKYLRFYLPNFHKLYIVTLGDTISSWMTISSIFHKVKNTSMQIYEEAVLFNGLFLKLIKHQTEEICLIAVEENGLA